MKSQVALKSEAVAKVPFVDLKRQQDMAIADIRKAFDRVTNNCSYILGEEAVNFERDWADYCGVKHAIGCANGTDAVELMLLALGVGAGDEVISVSHTFFATTESIVSTGATPILIDVLPNTGLMDPTKIEAAITPRTKAILPVHLYGQPAAMDEIMAIANKHKIPCVADGAQIHGAKYKGKPVSKTGLATSFSFFPGKNLGALGDAGAIVTDDDGFAETVRALRDHGRKAGQKYDHGQFGWNKRIDGMQAAFLRAKLKYLDRWNADREIVAKIYDENLKGLPGIKFIEATKDVHPAYHLYVLCLEDREGTKKKLEAMGIGTGIHYPHGVHRQPAWRTKFSPISLPVTEYIADHCLSLPLFGGMTEEEAFRVVDSVKQLFS